MVAQIPTDVFTAALDSVYAAAVARTPEAQRDTLTRAKEIARIGKVHLVNDHEERVLSSDGATWYTTNGSCECKDAHFHPETVCKHRMAARLVRRVHQLVEAEQATTATEAGKARSEETRRAHDLERFAAQVGFFAPEPVATTETAKPLPYSLRAEDTCLIQGKMFIRYSALLRLAHDRGLVSLTADWTYNDGELSLAHAVATFQDGRRFEEAGDATPANTNRKVAVHFRRVALTRAKARALRDALGIDMTAVEELAD